MNTTMHPADRTLLELAARAAGIRIKWDARGPYRVSAGISGGPTWNPLASLADALQLAVLVDAWPYASGSNRIGVWRAQPNGKMLDVYGVDCWHGDVRPTETTPWEPTKEAATCRAITRAAAEIEVERMRADAAYGLRVDLRRRHP